MDGPKFDPNRTKIGADTMAAFIAGGITGDLNEVPGIGPASITKLKECSVTYDSNGNEVRIPGVTSTFGLIGVFLSFKNAMNEDGTPRDVPPIELAQKFFNWLSFLGIAGSHRTTIVCAIAEKVNVSYPGIYDSTLYDSSDA